MQIEAYNEEMKSEIAVTRRAAYAAEGAVQKLEREKLEQDLRCGQCGVQLGKLASMQGAVGLRRKGRGRGESLSLIKRLTCLSPACPLRIDTLQENLKAQALSLSNH